MIYGHQIKNSDEAIKGGSDWVQCVSYTFLTISSFITLGLVITLLLFQMQVHGRNLSCFKKTKTIAVCFTLAFNISLILDLVVYPHLTYFWDLSIDLLQFTSKYLAIIALSHYFISRSVDFIKKEEKIVVKHLFKAEIVGTCLILLSLIASRLIIYTKANKYPRGSDEYMDIVFHHCKEWITIFQFFFWWLSNILLMFIGIKIGRAILNSNLQMMLLEKDSFYR